MESARRHPGDASVPTPHTPVSIKKHQMCDSGLTCESGTVFQEITIQVQTNVCLKEFGESFQDLSPGKRGESDTRYKYKVHCFGTMFMSMPFVYVHACWKYSSSRCLSGFGT